MAKASGRQPESYALGAVRGWLRNRGWFVVRMQQGLGCHKGIADLYAIKGGRSVWVEVKTATGKQSPKQVEFQFCIESAGGEYRVARGIDDVSDL